VNGVLHRVLPVQPRHDRVKDLLPVEEPGVVRVILDMVLRQVREVPQTERRNLLVFLDGSKR